jgi:hypothetical protein
MLNYDAGNVRWIRKKGTEKTHRAKLDGIPQAVVSPSMRRDLAAVSVIQEEVFGYLLGRWLSGITTVAPSLLRREKVDRHLSVISSI